jgi:hypothetical protein
VTTDLGLANLAGRCAHGFAPEQSSLHECDAFDEWATFRSALTAAARDGKVHQADVRPLIRGRIEPKHIGTLYRRARTEGLLVEVAHERSDDLEGKNAGRLEPVYELRAA